MTEGAPSNTSEQISNQHYAIEVWDVASLDKESLTKDMVAISSIDQEAFGNEHGLNVAGTIEFFRLFPDAITIVIRDSDSEKKEIVGFSIVEPLETVFTDDVYVGRVPSTNTAYITKTAIALEHRGKHLVEQIMARLESELKQKGFQFIERDASTFTEEGKESYADQIIKHNPDRIIHTQLHDSPLGPQLFIRMRL
jgi:ribosomal protein S18 acetylase RimI-like enzyme